jgi:uncharacterized DUF497 family protein
VREASTVLFGPKYEWRREDAQRNEAEWGIPFEDAVTVLESFDAAVVGTSPPDPNRSLVLGRSLCQVILVVCTERGPRTRVLAARPAMPHERAALDRAA